jgi:NIMA-interacting peptidyl-prolyl cis-trans isomerase 1
MSSFNTGSGVCLRITPRALCTNLKKKLNMSDKLRASHILVKHQGSRRLSSWRDPSGEEIRARTVEEAVSKLQELRKVRTLSSQLTVQEILSEKTTFAEVAQHLSDCGSAQDGGDLGWFGPGEMYQEFEDATRALAVGQISGVVHTGSGAHLILRTG